MLKHLLYLMRVGEKSVQRRVALALAHLCAPEDQSSVFIDNNGKQFCKRWKLYIFISILLYGVLYEFKFWVIQVSTCFLIFLFPWVQNINKMAQQHYTNWPTKLQHFLPWMLPLHLQHLRHAKELLNSNLLCIMYAVWVPVTLWADCGMVKNSITMAWPSVC